MAKIIKFMVESQPELPHLEIDTHLAIPNIKGKIDYSPRGSTLQKNRSGSPRHGSVLSNGENSAKDTDALEAMRQRMDKQNEIGQVEEVQMSFASRMKQKLENCKNLVQIKSATFREHFEETGKETTYDIRSLWLLHGNWWLRKKLVWLVEWKPFENFITLVILANSVMLACTDYNDRLYNDYVSISNLNMAQVDTAFSIIFLVECILKILAMGFLLHKNSYMRDRWNWLDIFVVSISVVSWIPGIEGNSSTKSLRTFRILRPLRSINSLPSMKALIQSLLSSMPGLFNVGIFLAFIFTIFAIFGTHQFNGQQYSRCRMTMQPTLKFNSTTDYEWPINYDAISLCNVDADCARQLGDGAIAKCGQLMDYGLPLELDQPNLDPLIFYDIVNFNNLGRSLFTVFQCLTLESWTLLMYNYMDCNSYWISAVYFCFMVIFGSFFAMQLVLANIMDSFARDQQAKLDAIADAAVDQEEKTQIAGLFMNAALHLKDPQESQQSQAEKIDVMKLVAPQKTQQVRIANNAEISKTVKTIDKPLARSKTVVLANQGGHQLEMSNESIELPKPEDDQDLDEWKTNKRESFPDKNDKNEPDSDDDGETKYEIRARERSKRNFLYKSAYALVHSTFYNFIVFMLILTNTFALACDDYPQSLYKESVLKILNDFFTWSFTAEMIIKWIALGVNNYVHDSFNLFDAIVVSFSLIDWTLNQILTDQQKMAVGSSMQAIRALRLLRVVKLARSWTKLQDILAKTVKSMKDISNFGVLLFLFLYIYALLGMEMFANKARYDWFGNLITDIPAAVQKGTIMYTPHYNFDNIYNSLVVVFCAIMAEDWNNSMYSFIIIQATSDYMVMIYFFTLMVIGNTMLLSLFTAILLQNFEATEEELELQNNKPKSEFQFRKIFTLKFLKSVRDSVIEIFEVKSKRRQKKQEVVLFEKTPKAGEKTEVPDPLNLPVMLDIQQPKKNAITMMALLHYELNEVVLGVTKNPSKAAADLPQLQGNVFWCLGPQNSFRLGCQEIYNWKWFGRFIIFLIFVSTVCLAIQTPLDDPDGQKSNVLEYIDYVMTGFFICEMFTNIFTHGFAFCGPTSYIRNAWNILDFIIVCSATISVIFSQVNISFLKSLRVMRVLRPLRLLAKHKGLKLAISALFNSLPNIGNLLVIVMFFIFMLSILGCTLFQGAFYKCQTNQLGLPDYIEAFGITNKYECLLYGGEWINCDYNYDNVPTAFLTTIAVQSTEGWVDNMNKMQDSTGTDQQPIINNAGYYKVYGIATQIFITLLFLNLFIGVVIESFNHEKDELSLNKLLKKVEQTWIETLQLCYSARPSITTQLTNKVFRDFMIKVCDNKKFDNFILFCIVGNTISLMIKWAGQDPVMLYQLEIVNYVYSSIFTIEAVFKIFAYRRNYFRSAWNKFDFSVVVLTWCVVIIMSLNLQFDVSLLGMIARTLRIGRIFRLVKRIPAIQIILQTLLEAIPAISALGLLLGLLFFLYSIIGISQFAFVMISDQMDDNHVNFTSFNNAMFVLMRDSTGEAWDSIMFDMMRGSSIIFQCDSNFDYYQWMNNNNVMQACGNPIIGAIFFLSFNVIVCQIFLNLFIAIIIDSFLGQSQAYSMPVNQADVDDFIEVWQHFDPNGIGSIDCFNIEKFVCKLSLTKTKLVANKKRVLKNVTFRRKFIANLEIPSHHDFGVFMFVDTLQCMSRLVVEASYIRDECLEQKKQLSLQHQQLNAEMGEKEVKGAIKKVLRSDTTKKKDHKVEFRNYINGISSLNKNIASVSELISVASKMTKKALGKIDINKMEEDAHEIYSSKHYIYGELIVRCWRDFLEAKAEEIRQAGLKRESHLNSVSENSQTDLLINQQAIINSEL